MSETNASSTPPAEAEPATPRPGTFTKVQRCRICGNRHLEPVLDLGEQHMTGVFPRSPQANLTRGPLQLVKCHSDGIDAGNDHCGLLQLAHSYNPGEMYGENYGYRSGLNRSMVEHLKAKVQYLTNLCPVREGDLVVDIGSNDGTTLGFYPQGVATLVGIDPSAEKFLKYYRPDVQLVCDFFSAAALRARVGNRKVRILTSIAMFYDLERPLDFVRQVAEVLDDEGVWHLEQSYLPAMLATNSYDTVCHEHLEYYALRQIKWLTDRAGLKILDVQFNDVNGGSFAVTVAKADSRRPAATRLIDQTLRSERRQGVESLERYAEFRSQVQAHRAKLLSLLDQLRAKGKVVVGYGASTKGNVILQYCGITPERLPCIADVNPDKFGAFTPGTNIPIVSEAQAKQMRPDCFLVLPWHFRTNLIEREQPFLKSGGQMIFPLPEISIVGMT